MLDQLRERNAYLQAQLEGKQANGWRDIITAPRDGTEVLLMANKDPFGRPYKSDVYHSWFDGFRWTRWPHPHEPTHWMPLPPAPFAPDEVRPADELEPGETSWGYVDTASLNDPKGLGITVRTYDPTDEFQTEPDETSSEPEFISDEAVLTEELDRLVQSWQRLRNRFGEGDARTRAVATAAVKLSGRLNVMMQLAAVKLGDEG